MIDNVEEKLKYLPLMRARIVIRGFPGDLEQEFRIETFAQSLRLIRFTHMTVLICMLAFEVFNVLLFNIESNYQLITVSIIYRFGIVCPLFLFNFVASFFKWFRRIAVFTLCLAMFLAALGIVVRISLTPNNDPLFSIFYGGLLLFIIAFNTGYNLRFIYVLPVGVIVTIAYCLILLFTGKVLITRSGTLVFFNNAFFLFAGELLALISSFFLEYHRRHAFLLKKRIRLEEKLNRLQAIDNWKAAYRKYREIDAELHRKRLQTTLSVGVPATSPDEEYIERLKDDPVSSNLLHFIQTKGAGVASAELYEQILGVVMEMSKARRGCIIVRKKQGNGLECLAQHSLEGDALRLAQVVADDVMHTGAVVRINDVGAATDFTHHLRALAGGAASLLCFPVHHKEEIIGVCYLDSDVTAGIFTAEMGDMLDFLVTQVVLSYEIPGWRSKYREVVIDEERFSSVCSRFDFTERERELLLLLIKAYSNREICEKAFIALNTLRTHLKNIYSKAGVDSREDLINLFAHFDMP